MGMETETVNCQPGPGMVLVVAHEEKVGDALVDRLRTEGHHADACLSPMESLGRLKLREYDVVVCHLAMERASSRTFLELLGLRPGDSEVLLVVSPQDQDAARAAMGWVAWDYLLFPDHSDELPLRVGRAMDHVRLKRGNGHSPAGVDDRVRREKERFCAGFFETMKQVVDAMESHDPRYRGHCRRVRDYSLMITAEMGLDPVQEAETALASYLHDIGYLGIPDSLAGKPGLLDESELAAIRRHADLGFQILKPVLPDKPLQYIRHHHERWDGNGYPLGLREHLIPLGSRIIAVADAFDAMTSPRSYRTTFTTSEALTELQGKAGSQFDPVIIPAFVGALHRRLERDPRLPLEKAG